MEEGKTESDSCESCRYGRVFSRTVAGNQVRYALCHRFPPQFVSERVREYSNTEWCFPVMAPKDWCGEFQPKGAK